MRKLAHAASMALIVFLAPPDMQANEPRAARPVTAVTDVSDDFRQRVELASLTIPDRIWEKVEQSGWQVRLAEFVVDAAPSLRDRRPRGWPSTATWNNSDAVHLPGSKLLVLAEKRRTASGRIVSSSRVPGVLRHEFGHAFDFAQPGPYGARSATPEFIASYRQDVASLTPIRREQLTYYLQDQKAGRQEAFAEAFAILLGGGSDTTKQERFSVSFPHVMRYVEHALKTADISVR